MDNVLKESLERVEKELENFIEECLKKVFENKKEILSSSLSISVKFEENEDDEIRGKVSVDSEGFINKIDKTRDMKELAALTALEICLKEVANVAMCGLRLVSRDKGELLDELFLSSKNAKSEE